MPIDALFAELHQIPSGADLIVYGDRIEGDRIEGDRIEQILESGRPELAKAPREALANRYIFAWR